MKYRKQQIYKAKKLIYNRTDLAYDDEQRKWVGFVFFVEGLWNN